MKMIFCTENQLDVKQKRLMKNLRFRGGFELKNRRGRSYNAYPVSWMRPGQVRRPAAG